MMQVGQLKKWLENFPDQCECWAYEGEVTGVIVSWKKAPTKLKRKLCCEGPAGDNFVLGNDGKPVIRYQYKGAKQ